MPDPRASHPIKTPCVRICAIEPLSGLCLGCGRTLREIGSWSAFPPDMRAAIMDTLPERLRRLKAERPEAFLDICPDADDARA